MVKTKAARKRYPAHLKQECSPTPSDVGNDAKKASLTPPARRPVRPVDRQKMLDWMLDKLNSRQMEKSLEWVEPGKVFKVRWPHAASHAFDTSDADLFKAWAKHTGLYKEGDPEADHRKWKANFRCAIHSLPDLEEIKSKEGRKGPNACRIYRIRDQPLEKKRKKSSSRSQTVSSDEDKGDDSDSTVEGQCLETTGDLPSTVNEMLQPSTMEQKNIPDFTKIGMGFVQPNHFSGGCCIVKGEEPLPNPLPIITPSSPLPINNILPSSTITTFSPTIITSSFSLPINNIPPLSIITTINTGTTTTTTTTPTPFQPFSFPTPSPSHSPSPPPSSTFPPCLTEMADETLEDMIPVGVMICRQGGLHGSPSADMVLPASPPQEPQCQQLQQQVQEVLEVTEEQFQMLSESLDLGAFETIESVPVVEQQGGVGVEGVEGPLTFSGGHYLDISHSAPPVPEVVLGFAADQYMAMDAE